MLLNVKKEMKKITSSKYKIFKKNENNSLIFCVFYVINIKNWLLLSFLTCEREAKS